MKIKTLIYAAGLFLVVAGLLGTSGIAGVQNAGSGFITLNKKEVVDPAQLIIDMKEEGQKDDKIIKKLEKEGFSNKEILDAYEKAGYNLILGGAPQSAPK